MVLLCHGWRSVKHIVDFGVALGLSAQQHIYQEWKSTKVSDWLDKVLAKLKHTRFIQTKGKKSLFGYSVDFHAFETSYDIGNWLNNYSQYVQYMLLYVWHGNMWIKLKLTFQSHAYEEDKSFKKHHHSIIIVIKSIWIVQCPSFSEHSLLYHFFQGNSSKCSYSVAVFQLCIILNCHTFHQRS